MSPIFRPPRPPPQAAFSARDAAPCSPGKTEANDSKLAKCMVLPQVSPSVTQQHHPTTLCLLLWLWSMMFPPHPTDLPSAFPLVPAHLPGSGTVGPPGSSPGTSPLSHPHARPQWFRRSSSFIEPHLHASDSQIPISAWVSPPNATPLYVLQSLLDVST